MAVNTKAAAQKIVKEQQERSGHWHGNENDRAVLAVIAWLVEQQPDPAPKGK